MFDNNLYVCPVLSTCQSPMYNSIQWHCRMRNISSSLIHVSAAFMSCTTTNFRLLSTLQIQYNPTHSATGENTWNTHIIHFPLKLLPPLFLTGSSHKNGQRKPRNPKWRRQFRSNLTKMVAFYSNITLRPYHLELLQTTPFYQFLMPFITKSVAPGCIKGTKTGLLKILETYSKPAEAFIIGNKELTVAPSEFDLIMGIASGSSDIDTKDCQVSPTSLLKRKFSNINVVKPHHLKAQLLESIAGTDLVDIHDTVRILILHVLACILFVASNEVARVWMFRICDNISELGEYNWGKAVLRYLMDYVKRTPAQDVKGCTTFLQVHNN